MSQKKLIYLFAAAVAVYFLVSWYRGSQMSAGASTASAGTSDTSSPAQPIFVDDDGDDL